MSDLKKLGIARVADNAQALLVVFSREPTDDEMRNIDAALDPGHQRFGELKRERDQLQADLNRERLTLHRLRTEMQAVDINRIRLRDGLRRAIKWLDGAVPDAALDELRQLLGPEGT